MTRDDTSALRALQEVAQLEGLPVGSVILDIGVINAPVICCKAADGLWHVTGTPNDRRWNHFEIIRDSVEQGNRLIVAYDPSRDSDLQDELDQLRGQVAHNAVDPWEIVRRQERTIEGYERRNVTLDPKDVNTPEGSARWNVASVHHIFATPRNGYACMCGAKTRKARTSTEHIIDTFVEQYGRALQALAIPAERTGVSRESVEQFRWAEANPYAVSIDEVEARRRDAAEGGE